MSYILIRLCSFFLDLHRRWYGTNSKVVKDKSLEESESFEQGHEGEGRLEGEDHPEQVPMDNSAPPTFPDITQFTTQNASDYTTHEVFQQAVNSAWWLGYWTAVHRMKVRMTELPPIKNKKSSTRFNECIHV